MNDALAGQYGTRPRQHLADGRLMCYKTPGVERIRLWRISRFAANTMSGHER
jgi:hypothetical protein